MSGFDDPGVYYSDSFGGGESIGDEGVVKRSQIKKRFREFLRQFRVGTDRTGFTYKYRYCYNIFLIVETQCTMMVVQMLKLLEYLYQFLKKSGRELFFGVCNAMWDLRMNL